MISEKYKWLTDINPLPKTISIGLSLLGTAEISGPTSNRAILSWAKQLSIPYSNDDVAWCGLFVAHVVKEAGKETVTNPLWARNWAKWGQKVDSPALGDVVVFVRNGGGHVGFYIAEDDECFHILGGNQGNTVSITRIVKGRAIAFRRPLYNTQPDSVKSYVASSEGALSTNEA